MMITNIVFILRGNEVLLAMKKRGLGAGKWNGPGGKVKKGETIEEAAIRETKEEVGLTISDLEDRGVIEFIGGSNPDVNRCSIFVTRTFEGEPIETEEMRPQWFSIDAIPYEQMWDNEKVWLEDVLRHGKSVHLRGLFNDDDTLQRYEPL
ncbi:MAG: hypothetical protein UY77_C0034G0011 [Candidatus Uhrbacteria bacterium GW2011_GWA2_53_10]|uniref:Oxidized purine nucleoside triphosphate hydrolase n=1 Tax=Candidatus Uhrbacteria bacterium GW2011_GWA2_53_10 TaxID=1618980 RepID=A0A0G1XML1_9BACT|nr:MAG: hypothetical protein UY77_C0034G0011 [Candidatus Uhrbacteria bacterium GW2011_GWA2_53_10]